MTEASETKTTAPTKAPATQKQTTAAAAAAAEAAKRTITITFGDKEAAIYDQIVKDAETDDRTEAKYLAIWLRENYKTGTTE